MKRREREKERKREGGRRRGRGRRRKRKRGGREESKGAGRTGVASVGVAVEFNRVLFPTVAFVETSELGVGVGVEDDEVAVEELLLFEEKSTLANLSKPSNRRAN